MSIYRDRMTGYETWLFSYLKQPFSLKKPAWRNWQTRWTQNPVIARSCGFEPLRRQVLLGLRVKLRRKQRPHGLTREHDNRKDAENCSKGKEQAFNARHHESERVTFAAGKASPSNQNANRHGDPE